MKRDGITSLHAIHEVTSENVHKRNQVLSTIDVVSHRNIREVLVNVLHGEV